MAAPVLTEDYVEALTRRVDALEKKLLSQDGALPVIPLTTAVRELGRKLDTLAGREKGEEVQGLWGKIGRLESLVSPDYVQSLKMTEGAKVELLCGEVEQLRKFTDRMEEVYTNLITLSIDRYRPILNPNANGWNKSVCADSGVQLSASCVLREVSQRNSTVFSIVCSKSVKSPGADQFARCGNFQVHQLKDYINSTECQGLETHEKKLATVSATHLEQEARVAELTQQTHALMDGYRRVMLQLSAQCVQWDEALGERETAKT